LCSFCSVSKISMSTIGATKRNEAAGLAGINEEKDPV
jgi:hypothetical protein